MSVTDSTGWLALESGLLVLEEEGGLQLLGPTGVTWGRVHGELAESVRARLRGAGPLSPLFEAMARSVPGLGEVLEAEVIELSRAEGALRRAGWGMLFLELTARCNERCLHCYVEAGPTREEALDWATIEGVLRDAAALGFEVVQLTGGEALLSPFLPEAAELARALGIAEVEVYTNGVLLDEARYGRLSASQVSYAFSLYAGEAARHDAITRLPGSHARTVRAIQRALAGGSRVRVGVIAVSEADEPHALAAAALARELGVSDVGLDVARSVGRGAHAGRPVPEVEPMASPPAEAGDEAQEKEGRTPHAASGYGRRGGKAAVLADGTVAPCIFARDVVLGHVGPAGGLRAALEGPRVTLRRDPVEISRRLSELEASLACLECRLTSALIEAPADPPRDPQVATDAAGRSLPRAGTP